MPPRTPAIPPIQVARPDGAPESILAWVEATPHCPWGWSVWIPALDAPEVIEALQDAATDLDDDRHGVPRHWHWESIGAHLSLHLTAGGRLSSGYATNLTLSATGLRLLSAALQAHLVRGQMAPPQPSPAPEEEGLLDPRAKGQAEAAHRRASHHGVTTDRPVFGEGV